MYIRLSDDPRIIPGIRQDHLGRNYQLAIWPNGHQEHIPYEATLNVANPLLEPVLVESQSRPGVVYSSIRLFHGGRE